MTTPLSFRTKFEATDEASSLRAHVRAEAKNLPGVYQMHGESGEVLYVGKSKQVRTRLLSYFRAAPEDKASRLIKDSARISWEYTPTEFASLLRELELIKKLRPRYNVRHRRDRSHSFLKITTGAAPKLLVTRTVGFDGALYFGPFRGHRQVSDAARELSDVLGLRDCSLSTPMRFPEQGELFPVKAAPLCHRGETGRCLAPCALGSTEVEYDKRVQMARAFLEGSADAPIKWLEERMQKASLEWNYELAALLRDRIARLQALRGEFLRLKEALENLSFVYYTKGHDGEEILYLIRRGTIRATLASPKTAAERRRLSRVIKEIYGALESDNVHLAAHQVEEILLVAHWFRAHPEEMKKTRSPERWMKKPALRLAS